MFAKNWIDQSSKSLITKLINQYNIPNIKRIETCQSASYTRKQQWKSFQYLLIVLLPEVSVLYLACMCCFGALPTTKNVDTGWVYQIPWQLLPDKFLVRKTQSKLKIKISLCYNRC